MDPKRLHHIAKRHTVGRILFRVFENLDRHDTPRVASAIAFDAFLSLIPILAIGGFLLQRRDKTGSLLLLKLFEGAPPQVIQLVDNEFLRLSDTSGFVLAPISGLAFLWVSSAGISTAMGVFETIYAVETRPWYIRRAIAIACVIGGLPALSLTAAGGIWIAGLSGSFGTRVVGILMPALILIGLVAIFFRISIKRHRVKKRNIFPGSVVTVILWAIASTLFSLYVGKLAQYATLYGNLATVAIVLLWLWLLSMSIIVGGEVNAELERLREEYPNQRFPIRIPNIPIAIRAKLSPADRTPQPLSKLPSQEASVSSSRPAAKED